MEGFVRIDLPKHQVAIAGKVVDSITQRPVAGAIATIQAGPSAFLQLRAIRGKQSKAHPSEVAARVDRTMAASDGCFGFMDLPDGAYSLAIQGPPGQHYGVVNQDFTVQRDGGGAIAVAITQIALPATGAYGIVQAKDTLAPLPLARIRVDGGEESVYCDASGVFVICGVQPGERRLSIAASGFRSSTATTSITLGKISNIGTILLESKEA